MDKNDKNKILVAEDDADTRFALAMLLELEGFEVITAVDGEEAYSQALNEHPDLIVTDINMPRMNGLDLIKRIRKDGKLDSIPIVAMSAVERQSLNHAKELGAVAVAQKPIEFDQFLSLVAQVVTARSIRNRIYSSKERFRCHR